MSGQKIRIVDIAEELGLSTATVSNVIHGKTNKLSQETVKRVQKKLEEKNYIPNMAGILLAQNNSRIIGVVINDNKKYEGRVLEDGFVAASLNALSKVANEKGYFIMIKTTTDWSEISVFGSMWNMDGMILMGFCEADYKILRENLRIPFVIYDGYFEDTKRIVNLVIDHEEGGRLAGAHFKSLGFERALCIADNYICMDKDRIEGFKEVFGKDNTTVWEIPMLRSKRMDYYNSRLDELMSFDCVFAVSDYYALDFIRSAQSMGLKIPEDLSVIGFDDSMDSRDSTPSLTTIHQDANLRAATAVEALEKLRAGNDISEKIILPVSLVCRESVKRR
ncbi:MAG: LacI family DNA-binding transcriptional regulator [Pseudobutyrivibrio sp.]|nr:LacI family DNA-binding transcriptional regulator [Pseudobutyrivibrio sp.]